jgi:hypothetical protein
MKRIFISHASKDIEIVQAFMNEILIGALGIKITDIFCTTTDGTKIKSGNDWRNDIKEHLIGSKVTFLIITPNYKESEICLNEMGAAWVLSGRTIPLIVEPVNYESVGLLQEVKQVEKLLDGQSLERIKDILLEELGIPPQGIPGDWWITKKDGFLEKAKKHLDSNPFKSPVTRETFEKLEKERIEIINTLQMLSDENGRLVRLNEELKNAKNKDDVIAIEKKHLNMEKFEEFKSLCEKVSKPLSKFAGIVRGVIFSGYSGKSVAINTYYCQSDVDQAIAKDILNDNPLEPNWYDTKPMKEIYAALERLEIFIQKHDADDQFISAYESEFDVPLSLSNLDFWKEVLGLSINFE